MKLIRIKRNTDEEAYYAYDAGGRRNYTRIGNGSYTYYDYDINGRLKRVANHKSDESVISSFEYTLDPVGNRTSMKLASGDTVYYEYDGIYQLVKEDRRESDDSLVYTNYFEYDLAGNRTHLHYVDGEADEWTYYTYNIENQLTIEEKGGIATYYTYDAAGSLISKKTGEDESTYDYTYEGQMNVFSDGATNAYYTYDSDFRRVEKKVDGVKTKFEYSNADVVAEYDTDNVLIATYNTPGIDDNLTKKIGENIYFYVMDGLGSVRNLLDSDETIQNTYDYLAFGSIFGTPVETISNPFRFTSRRWDSESLLHYYRARMYDQLIGRFLQLDPYYKSRALTKKATNLYFYVKNNPVIFKDPTGLDDPCFPPEAKCTCCPNKNWLFLGGGYSFATGIKESLVWGSFMCFDKVLIGYNYYTSYGYDIGCADCAYARLKCKVQVACHGFEIVGANASIQIGTSTGMCYCGQFQGASWELSAGVEKYMLQASISVGEDSATIGFGLGEDIGAFPWENCETDVSECEWVGIDMAWADTQNAFGDYAKATVTQDSYHGNDFCCSKKDENGNYVWPVEKPEKR